VLTTQNLEENRTMTSPHPTFSRDLATSDFFLFGALKGQFAGRTFDSADEPVEEIYEMTGAIPRAKGETAFSNEKRDYNSVSTLMMPMSANFQGNPICRILSIVRLLMQRTYRTPYVVLGWSSDNANTFISSVLT
jgi:hypothetical protein